MRFGTIVKDVKYAFSKHAYPEIAHWAREKFPKEVRNSKEFSEVKQNFPASTNKLSALNRYLTQIPYDKLFYLNEWLYSNTSKTACIQQCFCLFVIN